MRATNLLLTLILVACNSADSGSEVATVDGNPAELLAAYTTVRLDADLSGLSDAERRMIPLLIDAAREMDAIYWFEVSGPRDSVLGSIADSGLRRFAEINYGPWDRLNGNRPFVAGVGAMPLGANFYQHDITKADFEAAASAAADGGAALRSLYTLVRRDGQGRVMAVPYQVAFRSQVRHAANKLREAAALAEDAGLKQYLTLRADALLSDDYQPSDMAWMEMKNNTIDIVIGPIETYDDQLLGLKAAHEAYVLVKDREWSDRLSRYAALLPSLQQGLPVSAEYKRETPGADSDLNAYDVLYYAGQANAGSKTIAINLPNDEQVQLAKGARRLQLKNAVRAKFDRILMPIAEVLIAPDQREYLSFDAFFENTMFHEVAHGLGIKNTITDKRTVREAMQEHAGTLEEGKADVLGLYMIAALAERGELGDKDLRANQVTFLASVFRSVRFGASSAHGRANVARFNYFDAMGAFTRDSATGTYRVDFDRMQAATDSLSAKILRFQGDGDYAGVQAWMDSVGGIRPTLQGDLDRLAAAGIPVDIIFEQGTEVLGLAAARGS
ncbi:MAG: hypothetical protein U0974_00100 [Gemmatimonadales bacterium]|nr:hypothetical protein [Gemmatimonadales bacterium]MDZ4388120.1 hypothetical protein [Gemmatimonadales bacterium]